MPRNPIPKLYGLFGHQAYSGAIEVGRPPLVNYDVEPLMSSVFALILNESPLGNDRVRQRSKGYGIGPAIGAPVRHRPNIGSRRAEVNGRRVLDIAGSGST